MTSTFNGPSDPNVALRHASDFLLDKCTPCPYHQTKINILKCSILPTGPSSMSVPELDYDWLCSTSTKKSTLPVRLGCKWCKSYFIHRGLVLEHIAKIGHHLDSMTSVTVPVSWVLKVPVGFSTAEVVNRLSVVIHIALPDIVELYHTQHQVYWILQSGLSGKPFSIMLCLVTTTNTDSIDISISMGNASLDYMAHHKKVVESMLLTGVDINHRETLRAAAICTHSPYARRSKQAMVFGQCKELAAIFQQKTPFIERSSSCGSSLLPKRASTSLHPCDKSAVKSLFIGDHHALSSNKGLQQRDELTPPMTIIKTDSSKSCALTEIREEERVAV